MFLSSRNKHTVRSIADRHWNLVKDDPVLSPESKYRIAKRNTEHDIIARRYSFSGKGFDSILTGIIVSLAIRFATKLLLKWLEEEFGE